MNFWRYNFFLMFINRTYNIRQLIQININFSFFFFLNFPTKQFASSNLQSNVNNNASYPGSHLNDVPSNAGLVPTIWGFGEKLGESSAHKCVFIKCQLLTRFVYLQPFGYNMKGGLWDPASHTGFRVREHHVSRQ